MIGFVSIYVFFSQHGLPSKLLLFGFGLCFFCYMCFSNCLVILGCVLRFKRRELNSCWEALSTWIGLLTYTDHCRVIWHGLIFRKAVKPKSESLGVLLR